MALCIDLGAAEYANSRPVLKDKKCLLEDLRNTSGLFSFSATEIAAVYYLWYLKDLKPTLDIRRQGIEVVNLCQFPLIVL